jgi:hypothetical protein
MIVLLISAHEALFSIYIILAVALCLIMASKDNVQEISQLASSLSQSLLL